MLQTRDLIVEETLDTVTEEINRSLSVKAPSKYDSGANFEDSNKSNFSLRGTLEKALQNIESTFNSMD